MREQHFQVAVKHSSISCSSPNIKNVKHMQSNVSYTHGTKLPYSELRNND